VGIELNVLGDVRVTGTHGTFAPARSRPGALLALLLVHAGEAVPVDRIIDELWSGHAPCNATKRVQVNVVRLRRALREIEPGADPAAIVRTRPGGYALALAPERVDAIRFERLVARGRAQLGAGDAGAAGASLSAALAVWRGDPFADYAYEPFAGAEIRRLQELRAGALEDWAEAELACGAHARMAAELEGLVGRYPLRERLRALLMLALYRCRRQGDALAAFQATRRALVEGLGIEPGRELRALQRAILEQSPALELSPGAEAGRRALAQAA
jgi:DNA-binding SARP family transcriptional activator